MGAMFPLQDNHDDIFESVAQIYKATAKGIVDENTFDIPLKCIYVCMRPLSLP